ncbi:MAG: glycosyltransferase family 4 protein [Pseudomonadota bacterium]
MSRLTVMQLLPALDSGGVERGTFEVAEALVKAGHRSLVVSAGGMLVAPLEATGSQHFKLALGSKSLRVLGTVRALRDLIARNRVDIVHARSRLPAWVALGALKKLDPRPRFVTTLHGLNSVSRYSAVMTRGDRVIAVSESARRYWLDHYADLSPSRVKLIHRGIDPEVFRYGFQPEKEKRERFLSQAGIPKERRLLMLPGRITETKGFGGFVNLIARLAVLGPDCHGVIVGDFKPGGTYQERLTERIRRLNVADRITFTGQRQDIRDLLAMADIVYSLSTKPESFGRTAAEGLALGRPVIGYDHGGVGEVLGEIFPEGLVPLDDEAAVLEKTQQFLERAPEVPNRQPFLKSQMQDETLALYQSLASSVST